MTQATILIVDDEPGVRELLSDALGMSGYRTLSAPDGVEALNILLKQPVDLMLIDINMPKMDGFELLERHRKDGHQTPAIMLSARGDRNDITTGLKIGADDYVTKPFGLEELVLRVAAVLRRTMPAQQVDAVLQCGPITLDQSRHLVKYESETIDLTQTEFRLLEELMLRAGFVVSKEALLRAVWDIDFESNTSVVDTYISYLRKKLHKDDYEGIRTIRGAGFQLMAK
ncbi:MAG: response regulator transcription factor [Candidatus Nanopelagicales bacterium]|nr:response regulator transcription factor [Candidatus Nanopelagicales bacterium]